MRTDRPSLNNLFGLLLGGLLLSGSLAAQDIPGASEWGRKVILSTPVSGLVSKVPVVVGDPVSRGTLLVEFDPRKYRARLAAAESLREAKRLLHEEAQRELQRSLELFDRTMLSDHDRQLAQIEATKAEAAFREAEAKLTEVRLRWDYSRVKAPFDGLVAAVHVKPGEAVVNRFEVIPLVTLVDHRRMLGRALVDERTLARVQVGDAAQIGVRGVWLEGEITAIGFEPASQLQGDAGYQLDVGFIPAKGMDLRSGEKLMIRLADE